MTSEAVLRAFRQPPTGFISTSAGRVAHRVFGKGPDVLFVHGFPVSGATFRRVIPGLAEHVRCHVLDLPGAGSSEFTRNPSVGVAGHIDAVRVAMDTLGLDDVAVVGHDSGGLIARHALAGDPRVRAFGLIDTELPGMPGWRFRSFLEAARLPGIGAILGWASRHPTIARNPFVFGGAFHDRSHLEGEFTDLFLEPLGASADRQWAAQRMLRSFDVDLLRRLPEVHARIGVPVRLVWGEQDVFFPVDRARDMVDTFPDAAIVTIEDAGLFSHEEAPDAVVAALLPLLSR